MGKPARGLPQPYNGVRQRLSTTTEQNSGPPTLSPFSPQSSPAGQASITLYRDVVEGSSARLGPGVRMRRTVTGLTAIVDQLAL
jgi:hypothetical protein